MLKLYIASALIEIYSCTISLSRTSSIHIDSENMNINPVNNPLQRLHEISRTTKDIFSEDLRALCFRKTHLKGNKRLTFSPLKACITAILTVVGCAFALYVYNRATNQREETVSGSEWWMDRTAKEFRLKTVFMVDTRAPDKSTDYWTQGAAVGAQYCKRYDCTFKYLIATKCGETACVGHKNMPVPMPWMKVKGILHELDSMEYGELALYIDSDFVMNSSTSIQYLIESELEDFPVWNWHRKKMTISFGQDGRGVFGQNGKAIALCVDMGSHWTGYHEDTYIIPINTGIILFIKTKEVESLLNEWWKSMQIPSSLDRRWPELHNKTRNHAMAWPWEQDRLSHIVNTGLFADNILIFNGTWGLSNIGYHGTYDKGYYSRMMRKFIISQCQLEGKCLDDSVEAYGKENNMSSEFYSSVDLWASKVERVSF